MKKAISFFLLLLIACVSPNKNQKTEQSIPSCADKAIGTERCDCQEDSLFKISIITGNCDLYGCEINRTDSTLSMWFCPIYPSNNNAPDSFYWNLGNNITSTAMYPSNIYDAKGKYDISARFHFKDGTSIEVTKKGYINL
jgi:hypothetical protein